MFDKAKKFVPFIRPALTLAIGTATYAVVSAIIKSNTDEPESFKQKATLAIGTFGIASLIAEKCASNTTGTYDEIVLGLKGMQQGITDAKAETDSDANTDTQS